MIVIVSLVGKNKQSHEFSKESLKQLVKYGIRYSKWHDHIKKYLQRQWEKKRVIDEAKMCIRLQNVMYIG